MLAMPDLDLIIQAKQGMRMFRRANPAALQRVDADGNHCGFLLLICCRSSKRVGWCFNESL